MSIRHPVWCDRARCTVTEPNRGAHRSAWQLVQPHEGDPFEIRVSVAERADAPGWPDVASVHVVGYHDAGDDPPSEEPTDVLVVSLRQAHLLARAIDELLTAVWYPEDVRRPGAPEGGEPQ